MHDKKISGFRNMNAKVKNTLIKDLMSEYQLSKASIYRYILFDKTSKESDCQKVMGY